MITRILTFSLLLFPFAVTAQNWVYSDYERFTPEQFFQLTAVHQIINYTQMDNGLLQAAMFHSTNEQRKKHGLPPFKYSQTIEKIASEHANDMVKFHFYSHVSRVKGKKTLQERFVKEGLQLMVIGENISSSIGLQYEAGRKIKIPHSGGMYTYASSKKEVILPHTYLSYAREVVRLWMNSPSHRKSILNPHYIQLGCGVQVYRNPDFHGVPYLIGVQNFGGKAAYRTVN